MKDGLLLTVDSEQIMELQRSSNTNEHFMSESLTIMRGAASFTSYQTITDL